MVHGLSSLPLPSVSDRDVMCLPALKQHITASRAVETVEAKFNVMQTVFITLQTKAEPKLELLSNAQQIFQTLFNRHFTEDVKVNSFVHTYIITYFVQYAHTCTFAFVTFTKIVCHC